MDNFIYKKSAGVTALSARFTDFKYKIHAHREYALGVTLKGVQSYNLEGSSLSSHENGVMLFYPDQPHDGMAGDKTGLEYVMVYIEPEIFAEIMGKKNLPGFSSPIVYDYTLRQKIIELSSGIINGEDEAYCTELLLSLAVNLKNPDFFKKYKKENQIIKRAKDIIHSNTDSVLKLEEISRELNISKFKFIRIFKEGTGTTPYQYFLNTKIELARKLIEKNKDVYSAIAEYGFTDLTHFNRHFKKNYGITPSKYLSALDN